MAVYESGASYQQASVQSGDYVQNQGRSDLFISPGAASDDSNSLRLPPGKAVKIEGATGISHRSVSGTGLVKVIRGF